jgi:hypothetical protein
MKRMKLDEVAEYMGIAERDVFDLLVEKVDRCGRVTQWTDMAIACGAEQSDTITLDSVKFNRHVYAKLVEMAREKALADN